MFVELIHSDVVNGRSQETKKCCYPEVFPSFFFPTMFFLFFQSFRLKLAKILKKEEISELSDVEHLLHVLLCVSVS